MTMAIVKLYAKQLQYEAEVRPNQDIFALGIAAIGGALLGQSLLPCGSLSRTAIMVKTNGRTQMSSLLGAVVVAVVILVATGLLTYVPLASLSAVVVMAVKNLIMQVRGGVVLVQRARVEGRRQQWEALIFWWTYIMALVVDVDVGLGAGMCLCAAGGLFELAHAAYRKRMERRMPSEEDGVVVS